MIQSITTEEFLEQWPKDESGRIAGLLLQRLMIETMMSSALGAECTEERAQAEAAANKTHANLLRIFQQITIPRTDDRKPRNPLKPLNRNREHRENEH